MSATGLSTLNIAGLPDHPPHDPTLAETTVVRFSSSYRSLGMTLRVETNDERIERAARESFGPDLALGEQPDVTIQLFTHHVEEASDWRPRQPLVRSFGKLTTVVSSRVSAMTVDVASGVAMGFVSNEAASHADFLRSCFVQAGFLTVANAQSLVAIHTACIWRDGQTLLVRGLSGAGKSTLCYSAVRHGWSLIAEDVVFIRTRPDADLTRLQAADIEVHGLPYTLHLLPDARTLFPELADEPTFERPDGDFKIGIDVQHRFPGQTRDSARTGPLVFVTRGIGPEPILRTAARDEAIRLLRETVIQQEERIAARSGLWDALLEHPAYILETGSDPDVNIHVLDRLVGHAGRHGEEATEHESDDNLSL